MPPFIHLYNFAVPVSLGSSRLIESGRLKGRKVGIVSNPASIDANYVHVVDALMKAPGVTIGHTCMSLSLAAGCPIAAFLAG